ncbi:hypothetical protein C8R44DRAFT_744168 [Mycena epipterygia]|nr:hypothetical protein C8R44DRAFT_744168 [Mycena epipterygia]
MKDFCNKRPSSTWIRLFLGRHPEIKLGKNYALDSKRAQTLNTGVEQSGCRTLLLRAATGDHPGCPYKLQAFKGESRAHCHHRLKASDPKVADTDLTLSVTAVKGGGEGGGGIFCLLWVVDRDYVGFMTSPSPAEVFAEVHRNML